MLQYLNSKRVAHRDLKLENILVDNDLNLKVADFGFATYKNISKLQSYRGTKTYMAPEIKDSKTYDGRQVDIFSVGVILFIIVMGIFPFQEFSKTIIITSYSLLERKTSTGKRRVAMSSQRSSKT